MPSSCAQLLKKRLTERKDDAEQCVLLLRKLGEPDDTLQVGEAAAATYEDGLETVDYIGHRDEINTGPGVPGHYVMGASARM